MADIDSEISKINNVIDLETGYYDDDDDFVVMKNPSNSGLNFGKGCRDGNYTEEDGVKKAYSSDGTEYEVTGIIVDFSDDDSPSRKSKPQEFKIEPQRDLNKREFTRNQDISLEDLSNEDLNEIDMETRYSEDDDLEDFYFEEGPRVIKSFDLDDEDYDYKSISLPIDEKKKKRSISTGEVEDDYWKKLAKKHQKTNVKGAAGWHERVGYFNPEREMELLNHDLTPKGNPVQHSNVVSSTETDFDYGDLGDASSVEASVEAGGVSGDAAPSGGVGESKQKNAKYSRLFESLVNLAGFKIKKDGDSYLVKDLCNPKTSFKLSSTKDIVEKLNPYIRDCVILVLQESTGMKLDSYKDWTKWYDSKQQKLYPQHKIDVDYCDLIENHIDDIVL